MKCLVTVAHPDDEAIFMGGTVTRFADWQWHVLALCRGDDPDRAPRFHRAAAVLGAYAAISDLDDTTPTLAPLSEDLREIKDRILGCFGISDPIELPGSTQPQIPKHPGREFDLVFTHGPNGEYGHLRHQQVHRAVREMVESGELKGDLVCFDHEKHDGRCQPSPNAQYLVELTPAEHAVKLSIVRDIYGFQPGSFEHDSAGQFEAFSTLISPLSALRLSTEVINLARTASI